MTSNKSCQAVPVFPVVINESGNVPSSPLINRRVLLLRSPAMSLGFTFRGEIFAHVTVWFFFFLFVCFFLFFVGFFLLLLLLLGFLFLFCFVFVCFVVVFFLGGGVNPTIELVTFCFRGWCMLGVFLVAGILPSGSLESIRCKVCVHRLDLGVYSHPKEGFCCFLGGVLFCFVCFWGGFWGEGGVRTYVNSKGKISCTETFSPEEDRTHDPASKRTASPTHYQLSYSGPREGYISLYSLDMVLTYTETVTREAIE